MDIKGTLIEQHLKNCFPRSFINECNEFICLYSADKVLVNSYFRLDNVSNELELKCKVLEYLSRPAFKGFTYTGQNFRDRENGEEIYKYHLQGINQFLGTHFTTEDIEIIYAELGNGINRELCIEFIEKGYDINILEDKGE